MLNRNINNTAPFGQQCLSLAKLILRLDLRPFLILTAVMVLEDALFIYMGWTNGFQVVYPAATASFFFYSHMMVLGNYAKPQVTPASGSRLLVSLIIFLTELSCMAAIHLVIWLRFAERIITDPDDVKLYYLTLFLGFCIWFLFITVEISPAYYFKISSSFMSCLMWMAPLGVLSITPLFEHPRNDFWKFLDMFITILLHFIACIPLFWKEHKLKR